MLSPVASTGIQSKLLTRGWPSRVAEGLQHMSVLCLRVFRPEKKHLKILENISLFLLFIRCLKSSHTCSVSAERPQDGGKSSQSASADPQDPERPRQVRGISPSFRSNCKGIKSINQYFAL